MLDARKPKTRLPDPGFAFEHECSGRSPLVVYEGEEGGKLLLSPY
jgi:hypothetical protein